MIGQYSNPIIALLQLTLDMYLPPEPPKPRIQLPRHWPFWALVGALLITISITLNMIVSALRASIRTPEQQETFVAEAAQEKQVINPDEYTDIDLQMQHRNGPQAQPWDGQSPMNILLLGVDDRTQITEDGPSRTDTMILVTFDPENKTAGMLSLPRDLWVTVPGHGEYKINQAYFLGEAEGIAGGGAGLALATVEAFLGIHVPYYAEINFDAFIQLIDEIDGVKINVPEAIELNLGAGRVVKLQPGIQVLPGDIALAYARMRDTAGGDFDRAARQQLILHGVLNRLTDFDLLPGLIAQTPTLYKEIASGVTTNLTMYQLARLAKLAYELPDENIQHIVITEEHATAMIAYNGAYILMPIPEKITALSEQLFNAQPAPAAIASLAPTAVQAVAANPTETLPPADTVTPENTAEPAPIPEDAPGIAIHNGTTTAGLAGDTSEYLQRFGLNVIRIGNADKIYTDTTIIDYTGNTATIAQIAQAMNLPQIKIYNSYDPNSEVALVLILGEDWAAENLLP